jgi:hypothetical protein
MWRLWAWKVKSSAMPAEKISDPDPYGRQIRPADENPRCWRCARLLAIRLTRPWQVMCPRCKAQNSQEV